MPDFRRVLGAQHHGRGAGVEQHRDARVVDRDGHDEFAAEAAVDDHLAARADLRFAGEQLAHQAVGEFGRFEAIGVGAGQAEDDRRPDRRAAEHSREPRRAGAPRAGERQPDEKCDRESGAGEARMVEPDERRPFRDGEEDDQRAPRSARGTAKTMRGRDFRLAGAACASASI